LSMRPQSSTNWERRSNEKCCSKSHFIHPCITMQNLIHLPMLALRKREN
jgi:hypothetical protein